MKYRFWPKADNRLVHCTCPLGGKADLIYAKADIQKMSAIPNDAGTFSLSITELTD
jgi:hypothetical protein